MAVTPASSATPLSMLTPVPTLPPGQGWIPAGRHGLNGSSSPLVRRQPPTSAASPWESRGRPPAVSRPGLISVGVSRDAGHTWQTRATPAIAVSCDLTVNPTDARDLVIVGNSCPWCASLPSLSLYRSHDGGQHWALWPLPPRGQSGRRDFVAYQWAWAGSTLFLAPLVASETPYSRLVASVSGQSFIAVEQHGLFAGLPADVEINSLLATDTTLYVRMDRGPTCTIDCSPMRQTSDAGRSWSPFQPTFAGQPVYPLATSADNGVTLLGAIVSATDLTLRTYLRSTDGGATWHLFPAFPARFLALPDAYSP